MKKRILSMMTALCLMLTLFPATAFAEGSEEPAGIPVCTCETACTADAMNADCPVCGAENAQPADCGKWEAPLVETTAVQKVQALIDALPDADTITAENRAEVEAQLTAIDEAKSSLTDGELDTLNFTRYQAAVTALNTLDGQSGAETPKTLETSTWKLEYITAVGNGDGNWLNNESWSVDADSNKMTEVSSGIWEITYNDIDEFDNYQVKFACNGAWQPYNWTSDGVLDGTDYPHNVVGEDGSRVTLRIDVNGFDFVTGTGFVKTEFIVTAPGDLPSKVSTEDGLKDALVKGGNIVLDGDITISTTLSVSGNVTLDLNGHVLKMTGSDRVITIESGGNLTLKDSDPAATHSDTSLPAGGIITGGNAKMGGGVFVSCGASFTMSGGSIVGCTATFYGGGVYCNSTDQSSSSFTMNGGTIQNCTAQLGSGVRIGDWSTLYADGGIISGNVYNRGTITRNDDATDYTTFDGTVTMMYGSTIDDVAKLTVTFDHNYTGSTATTQKVLKGQKAENVTPTRNCYTFDGWFADADCETAYDFTNAVTGNITLYAKWTFAGHDFTKQDKNDDTLVSAATCQNKAVYYYTCSRCGVVSDTDTFEGELDPNTHTGSLGDWQKDENGHWKTYSCCPTVKGDEGEHSFDATGKCECGAVHYTVTFDSNGGTVDPTSATTDVDGKLTELPTPARSDSYRFDGWFTEQNGGTAVTVDTVFTTHTPVYAHWSDYAAPTGEISLGTNSWKTFLNEITFGLFFKDTEEVTITATDNSGEDVKIEYLLSDKELTAAELATATFTAYTGKFNIEPNNEYVIYAKLSDKAGNVTYINSNGIVLDNVAPVISGITNGKTYCEAQTVTASDKYEVTVTVNGTPVTLDADGKFTLSPAKGTQTVVVTDKAGNRTGITVTVNDGHDYESKVTKEATTTSTGTKTYTCKNCGHSYEEEIAKLPSQSTSPKTGDETPLVATIVVTLLSAAALIGLVTYKKRGRYSAK